MAPGGGHRGSCPQGPYSRKASSGTHSGWGGEDKTQGKGMTLGPDLEVGVIAQRRLWGLGLRTPDLSESLKVRVVGTWWGLSSPF